ncbi:hypothetical protein GGI43DRAFT_427801 [Trichoderma evansii]
MDRTAYPNQPGADEYRTERTEEDTGLLIRYRKMLEIMLGKLNQSGIEEPNDRQALIEINLNNGERGNGYKTERLQWDTIRLIIKAWLDLSSITDREILSKLAGTFQESTIATAGGFFLASSGALYGCNAGTISGIMAMPSIWSRRIDEQNPYPKHNSRMRRIIHDKITRSFLEDTEPLQGTTRSDAEPNSAGFWARGLGESMESVWDEVTSYVGSLETISKMAQNCDAFVELMNVVKELKVYDETKKRELNESNILEENVNLKRP